MPKAGTIYPGLIVVKAKSKLEELKTGESFRLGEKPLETVAYCRKKFGMIHFWWFEWEDKLVMVASTRVKVKAIDKPFKTGEAATRLFIQYFKDMPYRLRGYNPPPGKRRGRKFLPRDEEGNIIRDSNPGF